MNSNLIDPGPLENLRSISPNNPKEFIRSLLMLFIQETTRDLKALSDATSAQDSKRMGEMAHKISSSSKQLGAKQMGTRAALLEATAKAGKPLSELVALAELLHQDFTETKTYFEAHPDYV